MTDIDILVVEDNHGDVALIQRAFETRELPGALHVVRTGDEALDWVFRYEHDPETPMPDLVLLDLNLPSTSGIEVLERLKADDDTKRIPVIVLTSSQSPEEIYQAYSESANACVIKPVDPDEFAKQIQTLTEFWIERAELPNASDDRRP